MALTVLMGLSGCATDPALNSAPSPDSNASVTQPTAPVAIAPASPATVSQATSTMEMQVVPGDRVGPVTPTTTRQELATLFGETQLQDQDIDIGEGMTEPGTVVNLGENRNFTVIWTDETRSKVSAVRDFGSAWKTPEGIGIGSSFADLQQALGAFRLYGFAWDYGGTLALEGSKLAQYDGLLILRVSPPETVSPESAAYQAVLGETLYPSSDPNFQALNLSVSEMIVYLTRPEA